MTPTEYQLTLRAVPQADDPHGVRRLRLLLKRLLRTHGFRCTMVQPAVDGDSSQQQADHRGGK